MAQIKTDRAHVNDFYAIRSNVKDKTTRDARIRDAAKHGASLRLIAVASRLTEVGVKRIINAK